MNDIAFTDLAPNRLYRPREIETLLGTRCLRILRRAGLCSIGGWYLGQTILDSFLRAWQDRSSQRVPEGKEVNDAKEHETKAIEVEKGDFGGAIQPASEQKRPNPLVRKMEALERKMG